jgi:hypothetical protein
MSYPTLTGTSDDEALNEIHIFLGDLNPSAETLQKYNESVDEWNATHNEGPRMKACFLALVFRDAEGNENVVKVMQSARYIRSNDSSFIVSQCHEDAKWFEDRGLPVVREKIEAMAYGILEIPTDVEETPQGKYFEFHIKLTRKDAEKSCPIEPAEIYALRAISREFSQKLKIPVPLSYNENKNKENQDGQGHQKICESSQGGGRFSNIV